MPEVKIEITPVINSMLDRGIETNFESLDELFLDALGVKGRDEDINQREYLTIMGVKALLSEIYKYEFFNNGK